MYMKLNTKIWFQKQPTVPSPYSNERLSVYMNGGNDFVIDYRLDLAKAIKKKNHFLNQDKIFDIYYTKIHRYYRLIRLNLQ